MNVQHCAGCSLQRSPKEVEFIEVQRCCHYGPAHNFMLPPLEALRSYSVIVCTCLAAGLLTTVGLGGFAIRFTVQFNLFAGSIVGLAGPSQLPMLDDIQRKGQLGCFLLTGSRRATRPSSAWSSPTCA